MVLQTMTSCSQNYSDLLFVTVPTLPFFITNCVWQAFLCCKQRTISWYTQTEGDSIATSGVFGVSGLGGNWSLCWPCSPPAWFLSQFLGLEYQVGYLSISKISNTFEWWIYHLTCKVSTQGSEAKLYFVLLIIILEKTSLWLSYLCLGRQRKHMSAYISWYL